MLKLPEPWDISQEGLHTHTHTRKVVYPNGEKCVSQNKSGGAESSKSFDSGHGTVEFTTCFAWF